MWLKDPKTGKESVTLSAFAYGFAVVTLKLLVSGMSIGSFEMAQFSGVEYGAAVGALGMIYTLRKNNSIKKEESKE